MKKLDKLKAERNKLNDQIALLESLPEDIYPFGTVALFSSSGKKWYYEKVDEETWRQLKGGSSQEQSLAEWIFHARVHDPVLNFEVYIMNPEANPIYATV